MESEFASFVKSLENEIVIPTSKGEKSETPVKIGPVSVKLLLVSTHFQQASGYSKVSYGLIHELAKIPWLS